MTPRAWTRSITGQTPTLPLIDLCHSINLLIEAIDRPTPPQQQERKGSSSSSMRVRFLFQLVLLGAVCALVVDAFAGLRAPPPTGPAAGIRPLRLQLQSASSAALHRSGCRHRFHVLSPIALGATASDDQAAAAAAAVAAVPSPPPPGRRRRIRDVIRSFVSRWRGGANGASPPSLASLNWQAFWCVRRAL